MSVADAVFNRLTVPPYHAISWPITRSTMLLTARTLRDLPKGSRVLDVGAGTGITAGFLATRMKFRVDGVDASQAMLESAHQRPGVRMLYGSAEDLSFLTAPYDAVLYNYVLRCISADESDRVISEAVRLTEPGGRIVVSDLILPRLRWPSDARILGIWSKFFRREFAQVMDSRGARYIKSLYPPFSFMMVFQK